MALVPSLSRGVIASHLNRGLLPPEERSVFKVLAIRPLKPDRKYRVAVTDGIDRFTAGLIVIEPDQNDAVLLPERGDIVDFRSGNGDPPNIIHQINGKNIWLIHQFRTQSSCFTNVTSTVDCDSATVPPTPTTPSTSSAPSDVSMASAPPDPPSKRQYDEARISQIATAKRSLFYEAESKQPGKPTHRIKDLNPYQNKYTILARCEEKGQLRDCSSSRWQGKVFNVTLRDDSGDIRATGFSEFAEKFYGIFEEGKTFLISHAQVKPIQNRSFNHTSHNYELILNYNTVVHPCSSSTAMMRPRTSYTFVRVCDIASKAEMEKVDVLGVCTRQADVTEVTARSSGRQVKKRDITLTDDSSGGSDVTLTLWSEKAEKFDALNKVVAFKMAQVREFNGKSLSLTFGGTLEIEPDLPEAHALKDWYESGERKHLQKNISSNSISEGIEESSLGDIKLEMRTSTLGGTQFYNIDAFLTKVEWDKIAYKACPSDTCNKKLEERGEDDYFCPRCQRRGINFAYRYMLRGTIADCTDYTWMTAFDEAATEILGRRADEMMLLQADDLAEFNRVLKQVQFQRYHLRVGVRKETYNDRQSLKFTINSVKKITPSASYRRRLKALTEK